uniref:39S ribosomal protein L35, mitochondrial n=1 Tax=Schistosoma haematobium TaxID=6185 RepID=A0A095CFY1_SCHHA
MMIQSNSTLCLKNFYGVFNSLLRHVSTTGPVSNVNNLFNFNQWRILQIPSRNRRSEEVKKFYSETGDYNPPNQDADISIVRSESELDRRSEHILTNRATTFLINNLLNRQWRTPKYYPNDIYEPYHQRTGVPWDYRLRKPKFFP